MFPYVCRNIAKQTFLETLQDNLIEMDILTSSRHDGAYNDGYVDAERGLPSPDGAVRHSRTPAWRMTPSLPPTRPDCSDPHPLFLPSPPQGKGVTKAMRSLSLWNTNGPVHINGSLVNMLIHSISLAPAWHPGNHFTNTEPAGAV